MHDDRRIQFGRVDAWKHHENGRERVNRIGNRCHSCTDLIIGTCDSTPLEDTTLDKVSPSQLAIAPPFRSLHTKYPVEDLARSLAEGIRTGHPTMPQFQLDSAQIVDVISYLKTLEN
jgi:hypothetical protein